MDTNNFIRCDLIVHAPYQSDVSHSLEDICHGRTIVIRLVGVGFNKKGAEEFRASGFWKGEVYLDHDRSVYDFFQLSHASKLQTMKCLVKKPIRALYASLKHVYSGNFQGDIFQTGAHLSSTAKAAFCMPVPNPTTFARKSLPTELSSQSPPSLKH
ncbi:hypothetical protein DSO57_1000289 [Entomophthora muscae]|uniref:Uncharacterized protein n=1 Tax=Entomophthora muscae TaxID=34485 RepID=A0ACC2SYL7_9FUNG|nr:hypothetical protein DSO57_1000289 [Entomophthora muscae]